MDAADWLIRLLATASVLGGFPQDLPPPSLELLPQHDLALDVCGAACPVRGAYVPGRGILISQSLDIDGNPFDRSVLLHEAVHYLQDTTGRFEAETVCERYHDREIEAYRLQDEYLNRFNLGLGGFSGRLEWAPLGCAQGG